MNCIGFLYFFFYNKILIVNNLTKLYVYIYFFYISFIFFYIFIYVFYENDAIIIFNKIIV